MTKGLAIVFILAVLVLFSVLNGKLWTGASAGVAEDTPTATICPAPSPEPFWVEPVYSPTGNVQQDITIYLGNGEVVTVTLESGEDSSPGTAWPAIVDISLLENCTHHLTVEGHVREINWGGCTYGGYTLSTTHDRYSQPLTIQQVITFTYFPLHFVSRGFPDRSVSHPLHHRRFGHLPEAAAYLPRAG